MKNRPPEMMDDQKRWLEALLVRLRDVTPGGNYDLDPVERELLLWEIDRLRFQSVALIPDKQQELK